MLFLKIDTARYLSILRKKTSASHPEIQNVYFLFIAYPKILFLCQLQQMQPNQFLQTHYKWEVILLTCMLPGSASLPHHQWLTGPTMIQQWQQKQPIGANLGRQLILHTPHTCANVVVLSVKAAPAITGNSPESKQPFHKSFMNS